MVPPYSDQVSRVWPYSGSCAAAFVFTYVTLTLFGGPSHTLRLTIAVLKAVRTPKVFLPSVWPLPRSLATTYGISVDVSSSPYLDVSVQAVPSIHLFDSVYGTGVLLRWVSPFRNRFSVWYRSIAPVGFPIQKSADQRLFASPRSLSQLITSFIGSQCQGIRPAPFLA